MITMTMNDNNEEDYDNIDKDLFFVLWGIFFFGGGKVWERRWRWRSLITLCYSFKAFIIDFDM